MSKIESSCVLITGGCSGIGKIMARRVLERGGKVVVWDINPKSVDQTLLEFKILGSIVGFVVDVSDKESVAKAASDTLESVGQVDIIINNAGVVVGKSFVDHTLAEIDKTIQINTLGAMYVTHQFLGDMVKRDKGHICTIASSAGLVGNPNMSVYAASKWAALGWSDSIRLELKKSQSGVKVTSILPYYISTGMFDGVHSALIPILKPESAAEKILRSIEKNVKIRTIPGYLYILTRVMQGISVSLFDLCAGKIFGIYDSMNNFKGRK